MFIFSFVVRRPLLRGWRGIARAPERRSKLPDGSRRRRLGKVPVVGSPYAPTRGHKRYKQRDRLWTMNVHRCCCIAFTRKGRRFLRSESLAWGALEDIKPYARDAFSCGQTTRWPRLRSRPFERVAASIRFCLQRRRPCCS